MPTISPARTSNDTSLEPAGRREVLDAQDRVGAVHAGTAVGYCSSMLAADHQADEFVLAGSTPGTSATKCPSRSTATVSPISAISSRWWLMNSIPTPRARSSRDDPEERLGLVAGECCRGLVQDQDPRVHAQRLRDLDQLLSGDAELADLRVDVDVEPDHGERGLGRRRLSVFRSTSPKRVGNRPIITFSATLSEPTRLSSWWIVAMPSFSAAVRVGQAHLGSVDQDRPPSGWYTPDIILMRVDLPAPFSPRSTWTLPAWT